MASRVCRPQTTRVDVSGGDWILVRKKLNAGEMRAYMSSIRKETTDGRLTVDPMKVNVGRTLAYLLDWSFTDDSGAVIPIAGKTPEQMQAAIDALDVDSYKELWKAIETHEEAIDAAAVTEKNVQAGETPSSAISSSPSESAGVLSGSAN